MIAGAAPFVPLRYCLRSQDERFGDDGLPLLAVTLSAGVVRRDDLTADEPRAEDLSSYKRCCAGDLVVNRMRAFQGALGVAPCDGLVSPDYLVLRAHPTVSSAYVAYFLRSSRGIGEMTSRIRGIGGVESGVTRTPRINLQDLKNIAIRLPALSVQCSIVEFLDRECARIRELTRELEGLAAALRQQERDHFARLVRPNASVIPLRYLLTSVDQGWSPECEAREAEEGEWGVLKVGCVNRNRFRPMEHKRLPDGLEPRLRAEIRVGELLMSRANTRELVGSAAVVTTTAGRRLMLSDKLYRLRFNAAVLPQYVALALCDQGARDQIEIATAGASSSMQNISQDLVRGLRIPMAALDEQRRVVATLEAHHHRLSQAQDEVLHLMRSLADYRDALITEAVTGELDVSQLSDAQVDESTQAAFEGERPEALSG